MGRRFVAAIAWLIVFAVPVQGLAATMMLHCAPGHGGAPEGNMTSAHPRDGHAHSHPQGASEARAVSHTHSAIGATDSGAANPTGFVEKCSACASCCIGVGLTVTPRLVTPTQSHDSPLPSAVESVL